MKYSGVLVTLMLAAVTGYASAQCTDAQTNAGGADDKGDCPASLTDDDGTTSCTQTLTLGTCTATICANGLAAVTAGTCTLNTWVYDALDTDASYACDTTTAGTAAETKTRNVECKTVAGATVDDILCTGNKPTDLSNTCAAVPNVCSAELTLTCTAGYIVPRGSPGNPYLNTTGKPITGCPCKFKKSCNNCCIVEHGAFLVPC